MLLGLPTVVARSLSIPLSGRPVLCRLRWIHRLLDDVQASRTVNAMHSDGDSQLFAELS